MTSNAGVQHKEIHVGFGTNEAMKEASILDTLGHFFKPEFLNRFDNIIEFKSLDKDHLLEIVDLMLKDLKNTLFEQTIELTISNEVKVKLADLGYNPAFGARPLRRVIQEQLEDKLADFIIEEANAHQLHAVLENDEIMIKAM